MNISDITNESVKKILLGGGIYSMFAGAVGIVGFPACEKDKQLATAVNYYQIKDIVDNMSPDQRLLFLPTSYLRHHHGCYGGFHAPWHRRCGETGHDQT